MHFSWKRVLQVIILLIFLGGMILLSKITQPPIVEARAIDVRIKMRQHFFPIHPQETSSNEPKSILFVGDSRFVGMSNVENGEEVFLAEVGKGYSYLCLLQEDVKKEDVDVVAVGFGVNDLYNVKKYVEYLNSNPYNAEIYFLTVNPVDEEKERQYGYKVTNDEIDAFNEYIKENASGYTVIDTNSYLWDIGFSTRDGLHYTDDTYREIYNYLTTILR